jgi:hydrogenase nickel incorporation protein HypA/HybF
VTEETAARGAELVITEVPLRAWCRRCGDEFDSPAVLASCRTCGLSGVELVHGRELRVTSFDAE